MNAKDLALVAEMIAAATAPLIETINALEQRTHNYATRLTVHRIASSARIARLEALVPKKPAPPRARLTKAQWDAATASLCVRLAPKTFFAPSDVHAEHATLEAALDATAASCRAEDEEMLQEPRQAKAVMAVVDEEEVCF